MISVVPEQAALLRHDFPPNAARRRRTPNMWDYLGAAGVFYVLVFFGLPIVLLVIRSLTDPGPENYTQAVTTSIYTDSIIRTLKISLVVMVLCLAIAYPYAYVMSRVSPRIRALLMAFVLFSLWSSILVRTYALTILLQNTGLINSALLSMGVIEEPISMIRNTLGVYIGMVNVLLPFAILPIYNQLRTIERDLDPAARGLGASPLRAFVRITLPLSVPGVLVSGVLVFVMSLGFYVTPALLGGPADIMIAQMIAQQVQTLLHTGFGSALSIILLVVILALLAVISRVIRLDAVFGLGGKR